MDRLEDEKFTRFLESKAAEAKQALKYNPNHFLAMLRSNGGYATVSKLLVSKTPSDGFTKLWEGGPFGSFDRSFGCGDGVGAVF